MSTSFDNDEIIRARRRKRIEDARKRKRRKRMLRRIARKWGPWAVGAFAVLLVVGIGFGMNRGRQKKAENGSESIESGQVPASDEGQPSLADNAAAYGNDLVYGNTPAGNSTPYGSIVKDEVEGSSKDSSGEGSNGDSSALQKSYSAQMTADTRAIGEDVISSYALLIDLETGDIVAQRDAFSRVSPASMTKILTVLVAAEHVTDLDDTFTITLNETDYSYVNGLSNVGFSENETVTVRDLFYGTILPSGGDAAAGLAAYVAGTREAFVDMMNEKLEELGLSGTAHFTNCVGLYDKDHYCTLYDMAMILEAAIDNELCREVLSAHTYTTSATKQHPDGLLISNWFLRRIEDKDTGGEVMCAKTGFVAQSGSCAASYGVQNNGKSYICVTADSTSSWRCIYDHVALYSEYTDK